MLFCTPKPAMRSFGLALLALALLALAGCSLDAAPQTKPRDGGARAGESSPAEPEPLTPAQMPAGRLLFAVQGDLWLWQNGKTRRLTQDGRFAQAAFSPDGGRIACILRDNGASDLFILDDKGGSPQRLTANNSKQPPGSFERVAETTWAFYPAWSPSGDAIVYVGQYAPATGSPASDYNLALYQISPRGGERRPLLADDEAHFGRASLAPDGQIAVARFPLAGDADAQVYGVAAEGGKAAPFPRTPPDSYDPAFSPDGRWLAFAARSPDGTDIYALQVGGDKPPLRITSNGHSRSPAFAPDGRSLAFLAEHGAGFQLWVVGLGDNPARIQVGDPAQLTDGPSIDVDSGLSWGS